MYSAYVLREATREALLADFMPRHERILAHHVTVMFGSDEVPEPKRVDIVGYLNVVDGIEILVAAVDKDILRPDKGVFHITWSLDSSKYKPVDSNAMLHTFREDILFLEQPVIDIPVIPSVQN